MAEVIARFGQVFAELTAHDEQAFHFLCYQLDAVHIGVLIRFGLEQLRYRRHKADGNDIDGVIRFVCQQFTVQFPSFGQGGIVTDATLEHRRTVGVLQVRDTSVRDVRMWILHTVTLHAHRDVAKSVIGIHDVRQADILLSHAADDTADEVALLVVVREIIDGTQRKQVVGGRTDVGVVDDVRRTFIDLIVLRRCRLIGFATRDTQQYHQQDCKGG